MKKKSTHSLSTQNSVTELTRLPLSKKTKLIFSKCNISYHLQIMSFDTNSAGVVVPDEKFYTVLTNGQVKVIKAIGIGVILGCSSLLAVKFPFIKEVLEAIGRHLS